MGILCCLVALGMHMQPMGKVGIFNYLAGIVLPWGYKIGRGKLVPIVIESWIRWVLLGAAVVVLAAHGYRRSFAQLGSARRPTGSRISTRPRDIDIAAALLGHRRGRSLPRHHHARDASQCQPASAEDVSADSRTLWA